MLARSLQSSNDTPLRREDELQLAQFQGQGQGMSAVRAADEDVQEDARDLADGVDRANCEEQVVQLQGNQALELYCDGANGRLGQGHVRQRPREVRKGQVRTETEE